MLGKTQYSDEIKITDELLSSFKIISSSNNIIVLQKDNKKYTCRFLYKDKASGISYIKINGNLRKVKLIKEIEKILEKVIKDDSLKENISNLLAPMPGTVIELNVKKGDKVKKDDALIILEAMKMENVLTSPKDGVILSVKIKEKATVEKGAILLEFED